MEIPTDMCDKSLDNHREDYRPVRLTLRILIETYRRFGATCYLYIYSRNVYPTKTYGTTFYKTGGHGGTVVKVLCYKSEGRRFDPSWCHWNFSLT